MAQISSAAPIAERVDDALKRADDHLLSLLLAGHAAEVKEMTVLQKKTLLFEAVQAPVKEAARIAAGSGPLGTVVAGGGGGHPGKVDSLIRCLKALLQCPPLRDFAKAANNLSPLGLQAIIAVDLIEASSADDAHPQQQHPPRRPSDVVSASADAAKAEAPLSSSSRELLTHDVICSVLDVLSDEGKLDLNAGGAVYREPPIVLSVARGLYGVTSHLVRRFKADPNVMIFAGAAKGICSPLLVCCDRGDVPMARLLMSLGLSFVKFISGRATVPEPGAASTTAADESPLDPAASSGNLRVLRGVLFDAPLPVPTAGPKADAAATAAAVAEAKRLGEQRLDILRAALEAEPSCLYARSPGEASTLLHQACWSGNEKAVEALIDAAFKHKLPSRPASSVVDAGDANGDTPLFIATMRGWKDCCRVLIEKGKAQVPSDEEASKAGGAAGSKIAAILRKLREAGLVPAAAAAGAATGTSGSS